MKDKLGFRRWMAASGAVVLLTGCVTLWLSADAPKVRANTPPLAPQAALPAEFADEAAADELLVAPPSRPKSREEQRFARADRDDDGQITQSEYLSQRRRNYEKLDANGDGVLSFEEYAASGIDRFRKADSNGDGRLLPAEFATTAPKPAKSRIAKAAAPCPQVGAVQQSGDEEA